MVDVENTIRNSITSLEQGIIKTLLYFDIFNYPVTADELKRFHPHRVENDAEFSLIINGLANRKMIFKHDGFFSLNNSSLTVTRRLNGNRMAQSKLPLAKKYSSRIASFP